MGVPRAPRPPRPSREQGRARPDLGEPRRSGFKRTKGAGGWSSVARRSAGPRGRASDDGRRRKWSPLWQAARQRRDRAL